MAKKRKERGVPDQVKAFREMMARTPLEGFLYVNRCLITTLPMKVTQPNQVYTVLITVGQALWNGLMEDEEWKKTVREADIGDPEEWDLATKAHYTTDPLEWISIKDDDFYEGRIIPIHIDGFNYDITINKWMLPLKLKKSEYGNVDYAVTPDRLLVLRKSFDALPNVPDTEYAVYRLFRII